MQIIKDTDSLIKIILNLGSISGLLVLPYTIVQASKKSQKFYFPLSK